MAIKWHLKELMDEARLTYRDLNRESGVSTEILVRMIKDPDSAASSRTVDKLLEALQPHISRQLTTNDLQERIGEAAPAAPPAAPTATARQQQRSALAPPPGAQTPPTDPTQQAAEAARREELLRQAASRSK